LHIDAHGGGERGGRGGRGAPHVPPIKIFEKLPHKNAIKHDPSPDFLTTQVPPSKEFAKKNQGPPLDLQLLCIYGFATHLGRSLKNISTITLPTHVMG
jgi:hypothetical protein